jgi:hypothetical protein
VQEARTSRERARSEKKVRARELDNARIERNKIHKLNLVHSKAFSAKGCGRGVGYAQRCLHNV